MLSTAKCSLNIGEAICRRHYHVLHSQLGRNCFTAVSLVHCWFTAGSLLVHCSAANRLSRRVKRALIQFSNVNTLACRAERFPRPATSDSGQGGPGPSCDSATTAICNSERAGVLFRVKHETAKRAPNTETARLVTRSRDHRLPFMQPFLRKQLRAFCTLHKLVNYRRKLRNNQRNVHCVTFTALRPAAAAPDSSSA